MQAAWYEAQGSARDVLRVGTMPDPHPGRGELRVRIRASGINPGDLKKRENAFGLGMSFPRVIPHSDGAGLIDEVGEGVDGNRVGQRVWCFGAQSYRPFGTAAQYVVLPAEQAVELPSGISFETAACLGIAGITAHRAVHSGGAVAGRCVFVQGGAGAVGSFALGLANRAGALVIASVRSDSDGRAAREAGAHHVVRTDGVPSSSVVSEVLQWAPDGVHHVVEVAFDANIDLDAQLLVASGGSIAAYATDQPRPEIPFWNLLFKNVHVMLLGSDDFSLQQKLEAAAGLNSMLVDGWSGLRVSRTFALEDVASAHEYAHSRPRGRVVLLIT